MAYSAEISRANPACFLFLLDQSASMSKPFGGASGQSKAQGVADAINRLLQNLVLKCAKADGIRDYFLCGVLGYGGKGIGPVLGGPLAGQKLLPISQIANAPLRIENRIRILERPGGGSSQQTYKFPIWLEPVAEGRTPMCQALRLAMTILSDFIRNYPRSYPPLVLHITDGMATDGSPEPLAATLKKLATSDGNVLLFNAHLSSQTAAPIQFPDQEDALPGEYARMLFRMSSPLPPRCAPRPRRRGCRLATRRGASSSMQTFWQSSGF